MYKAFQSAKNRNADYHSLSWGILDKWRNANDQIMIRGLGIREGKNKRPTSGLLGGDN